MVFDGEVVDCLPGAKFKVDLDGAGEAVTTLAGKLRKHRIRVLLGDRVTVEVSTYDPTKGRITFRKG